MAVGEIIMAARSFKHPTSAVNGVTHVRILTSTQVKTDPGAAGSPGPAARLVVDSGVDIEVYGHDYTALLAMVGAAAANGVVGVKGADGANEKHTLKNVYFDTPAGQVEAPFKDTGRVGEYMVRGTCLWGVSDTFATMLVAGADT